MKLTALILLCSLNLLRAEDDQIRVVRHDRTVTVKDVGKLITNVIAFAESASVNLMDLGSDQEKGRKSWQEVLASASFIHVAFSPKRTLRIMSPNNQKSEGEPVSEILVSLPEGRYPEIRVKSGTNYMALTKWQPFALKRLITEPALELSTVEPYDHFYRPKEPDK